MWERCRDMAFEQPILVKKRQQQKGGNDSSD